MSGPTNQQLASTANWLKAGIAPTFDTVTPSDTADLPRPGVLVVTGTAGTIAVHTLHGDVRTIPAGFDLPVVVRRVLATGTTATGILVFTS